ncbi:MAG: 50S ribosomal protein L4 [Bacteroidetes bacterium]|nr:50S ribosomal protein L4 [Bacteroidota bacterium]
MKIDVYNIKGEKTSKKIDLPKEVFGIEPNDHAIYLDVKRIMASMRQGTHKTKERSEITGSVRKIRKQKGTGAARVGSIKNPIFRGGGRAFGPRPKDYDLKLNKKVKELARKSALSYKAAEKKVIVVEDFNFEDPKTKEYITFLDNLKINGKKSLFLTSIDNVNVYLSARNIPDAYICPPENVNTYEILNNESLVMTESAVKVINNILLN